MIKEKEYNPDDFIEMMLLSYKYFPYKKHEFVMGMWPNSIEDSSVDIEKMRERINNEPDDIGCMNPHLTNPIAFINPSDIVDVISKCFKLDNVNNKNNFPTIEQICDCEEKDLPPDEYREIIRKLRRELINWKNNHKDIVNRLRLFTQRPDLPVDRIDAYRRLIELQEENKMLKSRIRSDININRIRRVRPSHPGRILKVMHIDPLNIDIVDFANQLGVSQKYLTDLLDEKESLTIDVILRLSIIFKTTFEFWVNLQTSFNAWNE